MSNSFFFFLFSFYYYRHVCKASSRYITRHAKVHKSSFRNFSLIFLLWASTLYTAPRLYWHYRRQQSGESTKGDVIQVLSVGTDCPVSFSHTKPCQLPTMGKLFKMPLRVIYFFYYCYYHYRHRHHHLLNLALFSRFKLLLDFNTFFLRFIYKLRFLYMSTSLYHVFFSLKKYLQLRLPV